MSGIVKPTVLRHTLPWVDAYTMTLESTAAAQNHREIRAEVSDSLKRADREAKRLGTRQAQAIADNQRAIARRMNFSVEDHKVLMRTWKCASTTLLSMDWDLLEETNFHEESPKGPIRFWQGADPTKKCCVAPRAEAALIVKFLRFVEQNSATKGYDPRAHVKRTLESQGVTKETFHLYAAKLAITNPWLDA